VSCCLFVLGVATPNADAGESLFSPAAHSGPGRRSRIGPYGRSCGRRSSESGFTDPTHARGYHLFPARYKMETGSSHTAEEW
jgi:hypothetical protein